MVARIAHDDRLKLINQEDGATGRLQGIWGHFEDDLWTTKNTDFRPSKGQN